jgi:hypothetical protein
MFIGIEGKARRYDKAKRTTNSIQCTVIPYVHNILFLKRSSKIHYLIPEITRLNIITKQYCSLPLHMKTANTNKYKNIRAWITSVNNRRDLFESSNASKNVGQRNNEIRILQRKRKQKDLDVQHS